MRIDYLGQRVSWWCLIGMTWIKENLGFFFLIWVGVFKPALWAALGRLPCGLSKWARGLRLSQDACPHASWLQTAPTSQWNAPKTYLPLWCFGPVGVPLGRLWPGSSVCSWAAEWAVASATHWCFQPSCEWPTAHAALCGRRECRHPPPHKPRVADIWLLSTNPFRVLSDHIRLLPENPSVWLQPDTAFLKWKGAGRGFQ